MGSKLKISPYLFNNQYDSVVTSIVMSTAVAVTTEVSPWRHGDLQSQPGLTVTQSGASLASMKEFISVILGL